MEGGGRRGGGLRHGCRRMEKSCSPLAPNPGNATAHVVSVRRSGKTDTSSAQYGMMRRLTLTLRSLVGRSKPGRLRPETHGLPVLHDVSPVSVR